MTIVVPSKPGERSVAGSATNLVVAQVEQPNHKAHEVQVATRKTRSMNGPGSFGAGEPADVVPVPTQGPYLTRKVHRMMLLMKCFQ